VRPWSFNLEDVCLYLSHTRSFLYQIGIGIPSQSTTPRAPLQCPLPFPRRQNHPRRYTTLACHYYLLALLDDDVSPEHLAVQGLLGEVT